MTLIKRLPLIRKRKIPEIIEDVASGIKEEPEILGADISSVSARRLIIAGDAAKCCTSIGRNMTSVSMHYDKVLSSFKVKFESYKDLKKEDSPTAPSIQDKDRDRCVIKLAPTFEDVLSMTYRSRGFLIYILRTTQDVPIELEDSL